MFFLSCKQVQRTAFEAILIQSNEGEENSPPPREFMTFFPIDDQYCGMFAGGASSLLEDFWLLDKSSLKWTKKTITTPGKIKHLLYAKSSKGSYFFGGYSGKKDGQYVYHKNLWKFENDHFEKINVSEGPQGRVGHSFVGSHYTGNLYVYGGSVTNDWKRGLNDLWQYNPRINQWSKIDLGLPSNIWHSMVEVEAGLFLVVSDNSQAGTFLIDEKKMTWKRVSFSEGPSLRRYQELKAIDQGLILLAGGLLRGNRKLTPKSNLDDLWLFWNKDKKWEAVKLDKSYGARHAHAICVVDHETFIIYGGNYSLKASNSLGSAHKVKIRKIVSEKSVRWF